ncbi:MAG TPA: UDP-N-acetylmuramoyl-tripeptide--D-alanyl-D-alanine ligase [Propionibacteriaceae bacterium]
MIELRVSEIADVLGARVVGGGDPEALVTQVSADSRVVEPGTLFVALRGERTDGHTYVAATADLGSVAALTSRPVDGGLCLVVTDPLVALGRLARHLVDLGRTAGLGVVGITGSQGKTSTKDLLAQVLEHAGPTVAPVGNLNNELGVPLTITRIDRHTRFLVAEMGARGIGHIAYLCDIAAPQVGVVLNVGHAHVGEFGGQAAIAVAKGELVESLPSTGWAVLNADDPLVWAMRDRTPARVMAFAVDREPAAPAVWATDLVSDGLGRYRFQLHRSPTEQSRSQSPVEVQLRSAGRHQVGNAAAAAAAAVTLGLDLTVIAAGLSGATTRSRWRMELHECADGVLVINDAYNANPDSMRAAVATAAELGGNRPGRTWAVLGDMLELGEDAATEHTGIGRFVAEAGIDRLLAIGTFAADLVDGARDAGLSSAMIVSGSAEAADRVLTELGPGDVVLVKASRGLALNTVADEIVSRVGPVEGCEENL